MRSRIVSTAGLLLAMAYAHAHEPVRSFDSPEARQGVAVGAQYVFTINNTAIAKHDKATGELLARWEAPEGSGVIHLNSGVVKDGRLYCAHSNYPEVPMRSSLEVFDAATLEPVERIELGETNGSLTWMDWHEGHWWGCFAHYSHRPPEDKTHRDTTLVRFAGGWRAEQTWTFPGTVLERCAPYSLSGGSWGPDNVLYATGHDRPELYALRVPGGGGLLQLRDTIAAPMHGQAIAFDRTGSGLVYGIQRKARRVVTLPAAELATTE